MKPEQAHRAAITALQDIARGRKDNGRPLGGETAREIARKCLGDMGLGWAREKQDPDDA